MMYTLIQGFRGRPCLSSQGRAVRKGIQLLRVDVSYMEKHLMDMALDKKLVLKEKDGIVLVYPSQYYHFGS